MLDLAFSAPDRAARHLFLVAPDDREHEIRAQLARPAFRRVADLNVRWLPYGELERNREAMARFGSGLKPLEGDPGGPMSISAMLLGPSLGPVGAFTAALSGSSEATQAIQDSAPILLVGGGVYFFGLSVKMYRRADWSA